MLGIANSRFLVRALLGTGLLGQLATADAQTVHGALNVSTTVLASCEIRASGGASGSAKVICPPGTPYRTSLLYGVATGVIESGSAALSVRNGFATLTISY